MSFATVAPETALQAAQDLADIRALLVEAASSAAAPTTRVVPAAADEVSAAISAVFGDFGREFQWLSAQAQAFHAEFVSLLDGGVAAYISTEIANAEQAVASTMSAPAQATVVSPLVAGGLGAAAESVGALPALPTSLGGLTNSLTGALNPMLPGIVNMQAGAGPFFTGIAGPYEALVYNTWTNLNTLAGAWLADPFPLLRQLVANQMLYGQAIATAIQTGDFQPVSAIPGDVVRNFTNVVGTLTNTSVTSSLVVEQVLPTPNLALDNVVGLPLLFGASVIGPPAATLAAAGYAASLFTSAVQAGDGATAFAALIDAPAYIADGFLNGQATFPYALNLSSLTGPAMADLLNVTVVADFPLDGILHPPGYYPVTAALTALGGDALPPVAINLGAGSTPFSGLLPFLVNYAPQQLAQAIGAPAAPAPLISPPLFTF
ncbi:PE family protein [Mycobacterium terramassiliense]|uniref:PE-PGRS family protein n=1 Tax=Mycobacterium terramassiliense TaxID=1841859 RepID=A0A2U3N6V5_9MYCO|nr:PE family protein [Mycobacterium terramassiliense]SPM27245.1 PE-PGRS family protein [Mycobacterium terramassiliense]